MERETYNNEFRQKDATAQTRQPSRTICREEKVRNSLEGTKECRR